MFSPKILNRKYEKGDVVICSAPYDIKKAVCKRIAGVAGDQILVQRKYAPYPQTIIVPKNHVWLAGDNTKDSRDSRDYGAVPLQLIRGRLVCKLVPKVWPIETIAPLGSAHQNLQTSENEKNPRQRNVVGGVNEENYSKGKNIGAKSSNNDISDKS